MNLQQIKSLFSVNLLYANPQATQRQREKGKTKNLTKSLLIQYGLVSLIMLPFFGLMMLAIELFQNIRDFLLFIVLCLPCDFFSALSAF